MKDQNLKQIITRVEKLEQAVFGNKNKQSDKSVTNACNINFKLNERAFIKRYAISKSGPKKFTILLAYLSQGEVDIDIKLNEIKKRWNKMSANSLMGKFNMFYPSDAKTRGWIDSKTHGSYHLTSEWTDIL